MLRAALVGLSLLLIPAPYFAVTDAASPARERQLDEACQEITQWIHALLDEGETVCTPTAEGKSYDILVLSPKPVSAVPDALRAWEIAVVGAAGATLAKYGTRDIGFVLFADRESLAKNRAAYRIAARRAVELQQAIKANRITASEFREGVAAGFRPYSIDQKR